MFLGIIVFIRFLHVILRYHVHSCVQHFTAINTTFI